MSLLFSIFPRCYGVITVLQGEGSRLHCFLINTLGIQIITILVSIINVYMLIISIAFLHLSLLPILIYNVNKKVLVITIISPITILLYRVTSELALDFAGIHTNFVKYCLEHNHCGGCYFEHYLPFC